MEKFEVWQEGYQATGQRGEASFLGETEANSFSEACDIICREDPNYNKERLSVWGCKLFPTEKEARKSFG